MINLTVNQDSYLLDDMALALEPCFTELGKSRITRLDGIFYSWSTPEELLEEVCLRYGSTMKGRTDAVKKKLRFMHRTPVILIPQLVGVAPTVSSKDSTCIWLFNHPYLISKISSQQSIITLLNGEELAVSISKHSLTNQMNRLHSALHVIGRVEQSEKRKSSYADHMKEKPLKR